MKLKTAVYKVMIVDDEYVYQKGLSNFIQWEETPFSLIALANNGEQAMDMIFKSLPDIVISDIHMDPMDGIELARWINKNYPFIKIILMGTPSDQKKYYSNMPFVDFIDKSGLTPEGLQSALTRAAHKLDEVGRNHETMKRILDYIDTHYQENLTLKDLAIQFNFNYSYLSSYFVQYNGNRFLDYLNLLRIRKSIILLEQTKLTINEIREIIGYVENNHFRKVFKKIMKVTPSQYRKNKLLHPQ